MNFGICSTRTESKQAKILWKIFKKKKKSVVAKTFGVFHEIVATKKSILDRTKFVPPAGIATVFAELLTTVSPLSFLAVPIQ